MSPADRQLYKEEIQALGESIQGRTGHVCEPFIWKVFLWSGVISSFGMIPGGAGGVPAYTVSS